MNYAEVCRQANRVREVPLQAVLEVSGAARDRHDRAKWRTPRGVVSVTGAKFTNWNLAVGGGGAIDLAMHLEALAFKEAVAWLALRFPDVGRPHRPAPAERSPSSARTLVLPRRDPANLAVVLRYLVDERRLPRPALEPLLDRGVVYADPRANAVFLALAEDGHPVGAELRGTGPRNFRGMAPGSRKDLGFFSVPAPAPRDVVLCESAIDALSCHALRPGSLCVSTAGARPHPLWLAPLLRSGLEVLCGFDADHTGDAMARAMTALHPAVTRLRPALHDWNDVLRATS